MSFGTRYLIRAQEILAEIQANEMEAIQRVAGILARSVIEGGIIHLFGSGHSAMPTQEVFIRAGSLTNARPISLERNLDSFERIEGVGEALMRGFTGQRGEVLFVFSNSGVNPLPIEVALEGKRRGLFTVGVTSLEHSRRSAVKHSGGKRLFDVVDVAIDTHVPYGDAGLEVEGLPMRIGPLSTIAGVAIINAVMAETIEAMLAAGETPPVRISRNTPGGDEHNLAYIQKYGDRIPELYY